MVRMTRFGWHDSGPILRPEGDRLWGDDTDEELSLEPRSSRRPRRKPRRTSPVDRTPANNTPEERDRAA